MKPSHKLKTTREDIEKELVASKEHIEWCQKRGTESALREAVTEREFYFVLEDALAAHDLLAEVERLRAEGAEKDGRIAAVLRMRERPVLIGQVRNVANEGVNYALKIIKQTLKEKKDG